MPVLMLMLVLLGFVVAVMQVLLPRVDRPAERHVRVSIQCQRVAVSVVAAVQQLVVPPPLQHPGDRERVRVRVLLAASKAGHGPRR
jgi:hypothetical protein